MKMMLLPQKILQKKLKDIIKGINDGCKISNCELVGGETAEMPGTYTKGKFDIAGFCVGLVEKNKILIFFLTLIFLIPKVLKAKI